MDLQELYNLYKKVFETSGRSFNKDALNPDSLRAFARIYGIDLSDDDVKTLAGYYKTNPLGDATSKAFGDLKNIGGKMFGGLKGASLNWGGTGDVNNGTTGLLLEREGKSPINLGKGATTLGALYNAYRVGDNFRTMAEGSADTKSVERDVRNAILQNPYYAYDLSGDQLRMARQIKNGTYRPEGNKLEISDITNGLGKGLGGAALGYLTGNVPGAIIGGIGGLANGVTSSMANRAGSDADTLNSLYNSLQDSTRAYNAQRRQRINRYM